MEINGEIVNDKVRYADLNLSPELMRAIDKKGYVQATPVQAGAIPYFMEWKDVIAKAPTGTGKTFAFGIPMVEHIDPESADVQGLVLAPTRELAIQIRDELRDLCAFKEGVRIVVPLRRASPSTSRSNQLKKAPQIVVATPGPPDGPHEAAHRPAGQGADRGAGRGRPDAGHGLCPGRDPHPGHHAQNRRNLGMFSATISREVHGHLLGVPAGPGGDHRAAPTRRTSRTSSSTASRWTAQREGGHHGPPAGHGGL